jgi:hypothetical protein
MVWVAAPVFSAQVEYSSEYNSHLAKVIQIWKLYCKAMDNEDTRAWEMSGGIRPPCEMAG